MPGYSPTDFNAYQGATYAEMASYLAAHSGLDLHVAYNWLRAEGSSQRGNPLGVNYTAAHGPMLYPTWRAGLDAAVANLRTKLYAPVQRAIAGGSPAAERASIVLSKWAPGHYGYGARFSTAGIPGADRIVGSAPGTSGGGSFAGGGSSNPGRDETGALTPAPSSYDFGTMLPPGTTPESFSAAESAAGIATSDQYRLTAGDAAKLAAQLKWPAAANLGSSINLLIKQSLGQPNSFAPGFTTAANQTIAAIPGMIIGAVAPLLVGAAILGLVAVLGISGGRDLLGD